MSRPFLYTLGGLAACGFLVCSGFGLPVEIVAYLAIGWAFFLARVVPGVTVDWGGVAIGGTCLVLLAALTQSFLGWATGTAWKPRWTASLVAGVVLMFAAGISTVGIAHQVGWLISSPEPWVHFSGGAASAARRAQSVNNLKQIGLSLTDYQPARKSYPAGVTLDARGELLHGWMARMLPYLDQQAIYDRIEFSVPWDDPRNAEAFRTRIFAFENPAIPVTSAATGPAPGHYAGNVRVLGGPSARTLGQIFDGTSSTILAGEVGEGFKPWGDPTYRRDPARGINRSPEGFGSPFKGGANVLFADGSVHFLAETIDPKVLRALATPDGREPLPILEY